LYSRAGVEELHLQPLWTERFIFIWLAFVEADELLAKWGKNELEQKSTPKWLIFVRQLWFPMPIMIWAAIICEAPIDPF
jgi:hypothetical protein